MKLHAFILLQETAAETGLWPSRAQLSHGDGADIELAAEVAAEQIGVLEVYREAVAFNTGPIVVALAKINQTSGLLRNGRSRCLCGRADRQGRPLLRRIVIVAAARLFWSISAVRRWLTSGGA